MKTLLTFFTLSENLKLQTAPVLVEFYALISSRTLAFFSKLLSQNILMPMLLVMLLSFLLITLMVIGYKQEQNAYERERKILHKMQEKRLGKNYQFG